MKGALPYVFAVLLLGCGIGWVYTAATKPKGKTVLEAQNIEMRYHKLSNGTIIYEEVPAQGSIEEIEPAAGGNTAETPRRFKYDPLTQTYRVHSVDRQGNKSEDIIRDPRNP